MGAPALELQKAIFAALGDDGALVARLGEARVYDHAPANVPFPYVTFGRTSVHDWSSGTESGVEQVFTIHVWSKAKGKSETLEIMDLVQSRLASSLPAMDGHELVLLRPEFSEARYDEDLAVYHGLLRFRALTEAVA